MSSYYNIVEGNLIEGKVAKVTDINNIQTHIQDAIRNILLDLHDNESYVLGSGDELKDRFVLTPAQKELGRYIDSRNIFTDTTNYININRYDVKQPILKSKSSLYSIITKFRNTSSRDIPITCELQDEYGETLRSNVVTLEANTEIAEYEIVFDLKYYPTALNLSFDDLKKRDGKDIPPNTKEESFDEGFDEIHNSEVNQLPAFTAGVSKLYFVIRRANLNVIDLADSDTSTPIFDPETSLGVYYNEGSDFTEKGIFTEVSRGNDDNFEVAVPNCNIYYKDIYANETTYICSGGQAVVDGDKVTCIDTHVSLEGGSSFGNTLTQVYLDKDGHLKTSNKEIKFSTDINSFEDDINDPEPVHNLPVAAVLNYSNAVYGLEKEPLIVQSGPNQLPLSHHERLRRLEKKMDWSNDLALPSRIKYTLSGEDWVDKNGSSMTSIPYGQGSDVEISNNLMTTADENGNIVIQMTDAKVQTISITLKEKTKEKDGRDILLSQTDILNASAFAELKNMVHDSSAGTLVLDKVKTKQTVEQISKTKEEAKATTLNPWDDDASNRPADGEVKKTEREYIVYTGKNGADDYESEYPAMTFYTKSNYKFTKLNIPVRKFKNCSAVKFFIYKRQKTNNKKNNVKVGKLYKSKEFSLKKAKEKGNYQYMDDGFTINFGKDGLSLPKGQYIFLVLPIPKKKAKKGSVFIDTYKPKDSKDFCIHYKGAANASQFVEKNRYQEVWYNSAKAEATIEKYSTKGVAKSKVLNWTDTSLQRIRSINPTVNVKLKSKTCSWKLSANTGGSWQELTPNKDNIMNDGGASTFQWKIEFFGDGEDTPELSCGDEFAIQFIIKRESAGQGTTSSASEYDNNMCITSIPINGDKILQEYVGDYNLGVEDSKFREFEFARIWANDEINDDLLIDIQGADRTFSYTKENGTKYPEIPLWSFHYCDLTLDDFKQISVDYSDYTEELEYDENNMRLKLDSNNSYVDDDIELNSLNKFKKISNEIDENTENEYVTLKNNESTTENQTLLKRTFEDSPVDLTKYTGLKLSFNISGVETTRLDVENLGFYISSYYEKETPSNIKNNPDTQNTLQDTSIIPAIIDPDVSSYSHYDGNIIKITHVVGEESDGDKIYKDGYYQYLQVYDNEKNKFVYKLTQLHNVKNYLIYRIPKIEYDKKTSKAYFRIEIDQDSNILKNVREMGLITLSDEESDNKYKVTKNTKATHISAGTFDKTTGLPITLKYYKTDGTQATLANKKLTCQVRGDSSEFTTNSSGEITIPINKFKTGDNTIKLSFAGDNSYSKTSVNGTITIILKNQDGSLSDSTNENINSSSTYQITDNWNDQAKIDSDSINLKLDKITVLREDCYALFKPVEHDGLVTIPSKMNGVVTKYKSDEITLNDTTYDTQYTSSAHSETTSIKSTTPKTIQLSINHTNNVFKNSATSEILCYINNEYSGGLSKYKHLGIQLATDVYIPKDSLKLNLCAGINGEDIITSINLPTLNSIYHPYTSKETINLSSIVKKINSDKSIKSISISTTPYFYEFMSKVVKTGKPRINLFIGNITLYKAETFPFFHKQMRFKFYSTEDSQINHNDEVKNKSDISIRKIGAVLDYN